MNIQTIQEQIRKGQYRFSDHATKRMIKRAIDRHEIEEVIPDEWIDGKIRR